MGPLLKFSIVAILTTFVGLSQGHSQTAVTLWCGNSNTVQPHNQPCPGNLATTNRSVTIAAGNTFQTILAASLTRNSITIQNNQTTTDNCWVFIGAGNATAGTSILLAPGGSYQRYFPFVPSDAIQATCATTSDTLYVDTQ